MGWQPSSRHCEHHFIVPVVIETCRCFFFLANICLNANSTKLYIARFLKILANLHTALLEHLSATLTGARALSGAVSHDHHQPTLWPHRLTPMLPTSSKNWYWSAKPVITLMIIIIIEIKVKEAKGKSVAFSVWFIMETSSYGKPWLRFYGGVLLSSQEESIFLHDENISYFGPSSYILDMDFVDSNLRITGIFTGKASLWSSF